jgi:hypothetical protein
MLQMLQDATEMLKMLERFVGFSATATEPARTAEAERGRQPVPRGIESIAVITFKYTQLLFIAFRIILRLSEYPAAASFKRQPLKVQTRFPP